MDAPDPGGGGGDGGGGGGDARMAATSGRCVSLRGSLAGSVPDDVAASSGLTDAERAGFTGPAASPDRNPGAKVGAVTLPIAMAT